MVRTIMAKQNVRRTKKILNAFVGSRDIFVNHLKVKIENTVSIRIRPRYDRRIIETDASENSHL
jgi:hypothetical protein